MDDAAFEARIKEKIEQATGAPIELHLDSHHKKGRVSIDFSQTIPRVVFGADVLVDSGLARMSTQYAILSLKEQREVNEQEFLLFLRRN